MNNNLEKNTILLSIGTILNKGLLFLMIPLFSSWLSVEEYGTFDLMCTYITMLIPIISLSVGDGVFRFSIDKRDDEKKQYITFGLLIYTLGSIIIGIILFLLGFFKHDVIFIFFYFMLISEIYNNYMQYFLRSLKKISIYSFSTIVSTVATFILVTLFVKIFHYGIYGIMLGYSFGFFISNIIIMKLTRVNKYIEMKFDKKEVKNMIRYSLPMIPNSISWWIVNASDRTIINMYLGFAANGIYAVAYKIPNLCSSVFSMFSVAWQEAAIESSNISNKNEYYNGVFNKMITIIIILCCGILCSNYFLFNYIFDLKYYDAHFYVPILVTSIIFNTISQFLGGIQISLKKSYENGITTIIGAIINIISHLIFINYIGLYAAAFSTLLSTITIVIVRLFLLNGQIDLKLKLHNYLFAILYIYIFLSSYFSGEIGLIISFINLFIIIVIFILVNKDIIQKYAKIIFNKCDLIKRRV